MIGGKVGVQTPLVGEVAFDALSVGISVLAADNDDFMCGNAAKVGAVNEGSDRQRTRAGGGSSLRSVLPVASPSTLVV